MNAGEQTTPLVDLDKLRQRFDDDEELLGEIFHVFGAETPERRANIERALAEADLDRLGHLAHSLKGVAGTMFAEPLRQAAYALEMAAKSGDTAAAARHTATTLGLLADTCRAIGPKD